MKRWGLLVAAGLILIATFIILITNRENTSSVVATPESPPLVSMLATPESPPLAVIPSLLPPPNPEILEIFPEYVLERYTYDPDSYPQYAEVLPDAPCATWDNGGLTWSYRDDLATAKLGWVATVWLPIYRFCGFPLPYPQKPAQTKIVDAPREWVSWKATQMAGTPSATPESPPLPTIPTLLPPPNPEMRDFFPEYAQLERFTYDPDSYPQYAEVLPDAPCATWENGGLTWSYFEDESNRKLGWGASVWIPIYRFCGFPLPYPQKPAQTKIVDAPREWVSWKATQMAGTPSATPESPPLPTIPTLLPPPNPEMRDFFPEYTQLERFTYDPDSYPQYAEVLPEAPCATWENGGLTWSYFEDESNRKLGWGASVWIPIYRFCGFPLPYPQKPAQTRIENAPREWVDWKMTQLAGSLTPEPTSSP